MTGPAPMVDRSGYPTAAHPESAPAGLPAAAVLLLAELAAVLWPAGEYAALIEAHRRRIGWQQ